MIVRPMRSRTALSHKPVLIASIVPRLETSVGGTRTHRNTDSADHSTARTGPRQESLRSLVTERTITHKAAANAAVPASRPDPMIWPGWMVFYRTPKIIQPMNTAEARKTGSRAGVHGE